MDLISEVIGGGRNLEGARGARWGERHTGFGVDSGLVRECAETRDWVIEGDVDLHGVCDEVLDFLELLEVVLALDVLAVGYETELVELAMYVIGDRIVGVLTSDHAGHKSTKRSDTVSLANADD